MKIHVFLSSDCEYCDKQLETMWSYFLPEEWQLIEVGTEEFENHPLRKDIKGVPFIAVFDDNQNVIFSQCGYMDVEELLKILQ